MKKLWIDDCKSLTWDDQVPPDRQDEWCVFFRELEDVNKISFPRCIKSNECIGDPYLIIFCDGSEDAYGACAYVHWKTKNNKTLTRLLVAKSRVTPLKMTTIVRIELSEALLASRLYKSIKKECRLPFSKTFILTDSQIVFSMIQSESYGFATYTAVRVGEIRENSDTTSWFWIRGNDNIADWVSRGKCVVELCQSGPWQRGPDFLRLPEEEWPLSQLRSSLSLPDKVKVAMKADITEVDCLASRICIDKFSSYMNLLIIRVTARVLLLYTRESKVLLFNAGKTLFKIDLVGAEIFWINDAQRCYKKTLKGKFNRLSARKRDDGIIIVGCRVDAWIQMSFDNNDVILLPALHRISYLYVLFIHDPSHSGVATTSSKVRRRFWINGIHRVAKSIRHHCVDCKKERKTLGEQVMAPGEPLPFKD